jgi:hypothetical protein
MRDSNNMEAVKLALVVITVQQMWFSLMQNSLIFLCVCVYCKLLVHKTKYCSWKNWIYIENCRYLEFVVGEELM